MKKAVVLAVGCALALVASAVNWTKLDSITTDGNQLVKTGVTFSNSETSEIEIKFKLDQLGASHALYCAREKGSSKTFVGIVSSANRFRFGYGGGETDASTSTLANDTTIYTMHQKGGEFTVSADGDVVVSSTRTDPAYVPVGPLVLFMTYNAYAKEGDEGKNLQNKSVITFYGCKIWDNGTLVRDYVPAYNNDAKEYGLYDQQNGQFYGSATTPKFGEMPVWIGPDGGDMADDANWTYPLAAAEQVKFNKKPSADYTVKMSEDVTIGSIFPLVGQFDSTLYSRLVHFDLRDEQGGLHTLRVTSPSYWRERGSAYRLENGTIALGATASATNTVIFDNGNNHCMSIEATGENSTFIGNVCLRGGSGHRITVANGATWGGCGQLATPETVFAVTNGATWRLLPNSSKPTFGIGGYSNSYVGSTDGLLLVDNATLDLDDSASVGNLIFMLGAGQNRSSHHNTMILTNGATAYLPRYSHIGGFAQPWGSYSMADTNRLIVTGAGTKLIQKTNNSDFPLMVGGFGIGNEMIVTDHAELNTAGLGVGGTMKVISANTTSLWTRVVLEKGAVVNATNIVVNTKHSDEKLKVSNSLVASNTLEITSGAKVNLIGTGNNGSLQIAGLYPFREGRIQITGAGTEVHAGGKVLIGCNGCYSNVLEVTDGAVLEIGHDFRIGSDNEQGRRLLPDGSTEIPYSFGNVVRFDDCTVTMPNSNTLYFGGFGGGTNTLHIGNNVDFTVNNFRGYGYDNTLSISNGTLRLTNGFYPCFTQTGHETDSGRIHFVFSGERPYMYVTGGNVRPVRDGATFTFNVPPTGYETTPYVQTVGMTLPDDTEFAFTGLKDCAKAGGATMTLIDTKTKTITMSNALLAKAQVAAAAAWPKAKVTLSEDKSKLTLKVPRQGLMILLR